MTIADREDTGGHPLARRPAGSRAGRALRTGWLLLGLLCAGLGIVGAFLPLVPTTIFMILAAGCFARSSPRFEAWLVDHPRFGPAVRAWRAKRAIARRGKAMACAGMALGYALFLVTGQPSAPIALLVALLIGASAAYVLSRPAPGDP